VFEADASGQMLRRRNVSQIRFSLTSDSIRKFIGHLEEYAEAMDELQERYIERPKDDDAHSALPTE
jgi:hypothetical protein